MIPMVSPTKPSITHSLSPTNQSPLTSLNIPNCDKNITIANPLTNPIITGCGINLTNFPNFKTPANICITPIKITVANK